MSIGTPIADLLNAGVAPSQISSVITCPEFVTEQQMEEIGKFISRYVADENDAIKRHRRPLLHPRIVPHGQSRNKRCACGSGKKYKACCVKR